MNFHWQNLNDRPDPSGHPFWHGRAWWNFEPRSVCLEWCHGGQTMQVTLSFDRDEGNVQLAFGLPGAAYYLSFSGLPPAWFEKLPFQYRRSEYRYMGGERSIGFRIFDHAVWWSLWEDKGEWRSSDPAWMNGRVGLDDIIKMLLGKVVRTETVLDERDVVVPMPERAYPGRGVRTLVRNTRERWPWWPFASAEILTKIDVPGGVPVPGKGENSWDCGPDATYGISCGAQTVEEAVGRLVASVMRTRRNRIGRYEYEVGVAK